MATALAFPEHKHPPRHPAGESGEDEAPVYSQKAPGVSGGNPHTGKPTPTEVYLRLNKDGSISANYVKGREMGGLRIGPDGRINANASGDGYAGSFSRNSWGRSSGYFGGMIGDTRVTGRGSSDGDFRGNAFGRGWTAGGARGRDGTWRAGSSGPPGPSFTPRGALASAAAALTGGGGSAARSGSGGPSRRLGPPGGLGSFGQRLGNVPYANGTGGQASLRLGRDGNWTAHLRGGGWSGTLNRNSAGRIAGNFGGMVGDSRITGRGSSDGDWRANLFGRGVSAGAARNTDGDVRAGISGSSSDNSARGSANYRSGSSSSATGSSGATSSSGGGSSSGGASGATSSSGAASSSGATSSSGGGSSATSSSGGGSGTAASGSVSPGAASEGPDPSLGGAAHPTGGGGGGGGLQASTGEAATGAAGSGSPGAASQAETLGGDAAESRTSGGGSAVRPPPAPGSNTVKDTLDLDLDLEDLKPKE